MYVCTRTTREREGGIRSVMNDPFNLPDRRSLRIFKPESKLHSYLFQIWPNFMSLRNVFWLEEIVQLLHYACSTIIPLGREEETPGNTRRYLGFIDEEDVIKALNCQFSSGSLCYLGDLELLVHLQLDLYRENGSEENELWLMSPSVGYAIGERREERESSTYYFVGRKKDGDFFRGFIERYRDWNYGLHVALSQAMTVITREGGFTGISIEDLEPYHTLLSYNEDAFNNRLTSWRRNDLERTLKRETQKLIEINGIRSVDVEKFQEERFIQILRNVIDSYNA